MSRHFSLNLLFRIRNEIPVLLVITRILDIPSIISQGSLRFLCPICSEFNSAINHKANLATCFRCNKNFNPIDLLIAEKGISFVEAVSLLALLFQNHPLDDISYQNLCAIQLDAALQAFQASLLTQS